MAIIATPQWYTPHDVSHSLSLSNIKHTTTHLLELSTYIEGGFPSRLTKAISAYTSCSVTVPAWPALSHPCRESGTPSPSSPDFCMLLPCEWELGSQSPGTNTGTDVTSGGVSPPWRRPRAPNSAASIGHCSAGANGRSCGGGALNMLPECSTASLRGRTSRICGARARFDEGSGDHPTYVAFNVLVLKNVEESGL